MKRRSKRTTHHARHQQLQLMNDGKRWWIVSLMWEAESDKLKLPAEYLK